MRHRRLDPSWGIGMRMFWRIGAIALALGGCAVAGGGLEFEEQPYAFADAPGIVYLESFGATMDVDPPSSFEKWIIGEDIYQGNQRIISPWGVAASKGKVYINDGMGSATYWVFDLATRTLTPVTDPLLAGSTGIAVDADGNKYLAVPRLLDAKAKGTIGTKDESGRILVFDANDRRREVVDFPGRPVDIAVGDERLFVSDWVRNRIAVLDRQTLGVVGQFGHSGPAGTGLQGPRGVSVGGDGRLYVADFFAGRVKVYDQEGVFISQFGYRANMIGGFTFISGVAADRDGIVYAVDSGSALKGTHDDVQIFDSSKFYHADEIIPNVDANPRERKPALAGYFQKPGGVLKSFRSTVYRPVSVAVDYENVPYFREHETPNLELKYLIWMTSRGAENGRNVSVFGYFVDR